MSRTIDNAQNELSDDQLEAAAGGSIPAPVYGPDCVLTAPSGFETAVSDVAPLDAAPLVQGTKVRGSKITRL